MNILWTITVLLMRLKESLFSGNHVSSRTTLIGLCDERPVGCTFTIFFTSERASLCPLNRRAITPFKQPFCPAGQVRPRPRATQHVISTNTAVTGAAELLPQQECS